MAGEQTERGTDSVPARRWASLSEAATYAHVHRRTINDWIRQGMLPAYRIGPRLIQIDLDDLDALRIRIDPDSGPTLE